MGGGAVTQNGELEYPKTTGATAQGRQDPPRVPQGKQDALVAIAGEIVRGTQARVTANHMRTHGSFQRRKEERQVHKQGPHQLFAESCAVERQPSGLSERRDARFRSRTTRKILVNWIRINYEFERTSIAIRQQVLSRHAWRRQLVTTKAMMAVYQREGPKHGIK
ncbi:hypothetical protein PM082_019308 [Marasmius tenuissimus]|nr:hypothetical protein PM082_019308 [Marasmius tenuissimus]